MRCSSNKIQYKTRNDAIKENCRCGKESGKYKSIYRCPICNDFHLTSRRKNGNNTKKEFYIKEQLEYLKEKMRKL